MQNFDGIPLLVFFVLVIGFSLLSVECGYLLGERQRKTGRKEPESPISAIVASTLGLLAFLLAFTFNMAASRFDDRREAVLNEANAIGTAYLRADFLEEPLKSRVKKLFRDYLDTRTLVATTEKSSAELIKKSESIQNELWTLAVIAGKNHDSPISGLFVSALNQVIDMHSVRVSARFYARVPAVIWVCLLTVAVLSMLGVGYYCGLAGSRSWSETIILVTAFSIVIVLVADLDRPSQGLLRTPQQPLQDLRHSTASP